MKNTAYKNAYKNKKGMSLEQSSLEQVAFLYETLSHHFVSLHKAMAQKNASERFMINEKIHSLIMGLSSFWHQTPSSDEVNTLIEMMEEIHGELMMVMMHISEKDDMEKCLDISKGLRHIATLWREA